MAKVLNIGLAIVAVAAIAIPGVGAAISTAFFSLTASLGVSATLALSIGRALLFSGVLSAISLTAGALGLGAKHSADSGFSSRISVNPGISQWIIAGQTGAPTQMIYFGTDGTNNVNLSMIFVHAACETSGFVGLNLNNISTTASGAVSGAYSGILTIETADGTQTANPFTTVHGGLWTSTHIGRGLTMSHFRWTYDATKLASGLPQTVQFIVKGIKVYDPRRDSTVGGSGSMRANDRSTWAYSVSGADIGRNPALFELSYRLGWLKNGRLFAGKGEDPANFDYASYIAAANTCDEAVNGKPRYRIDMVLSIGPDSNHNDNLSKILATCGGRPVDIGGLVGIWVAHDDTASPVMTLGDDDFVGDVAWQALPEGNARNTARGGFVDAGNFYTVGPYLEVAPSDLRAIDNGVELADSIDLGGVQDEDQARRLANIALRASRQGIFAVSTPLRTLALKPMQVVYINRPRVGWVNRPFRVETMGLSIDKVQLGLRAVQATDYAEISYSSSFTPGALPTIGYFPVQGVLASLNSVDVAAGLLTNGASVLAATDVVTALSPSTSRLSNATGLAAANFALSNGFSPASIVASGAARDGDVINFSLTGIPQVFFLPGGNAASAGQNVVVAAVGLSTSGFTMKARSQSVTAGSTITDGSATAGGTGNPTLVIDRSSGSAPFDGRFVFRVSVTVGAIAAGEPGLIRIGLYVRQSGSWVQVGTLSKAATGTYDVAVTPGSVDFGAGAEFGISQISADGSGTAIGSFVSVSYTPGTVSETSLTPSSASPVPWFAVL